MDTREKGRLDLARQAVRMLRSPQLREMFPILDEQGGRPVVAALPDDTVAWTFERVCELGGEATVVMGDAVEPGEAWPEFMLVTHGVSGSADEQCEVSPDSHLFMLMKFLQSHGGQVQCNIVQPAILTMVTTGV